MGAIIEYEKDGYVFQAPSGEIPFPVARIDEQGSRKPLSWEEIVTWMEEYISARPKLKDRIEKNRRYTDNLNKIYPQLKEMWDQRVHELPNFMDLTWCTFVLSVVLCPISFILNKHTQKSIDNLHNEYSDKICKPYDEMTSEELLMYYRNEEGKRNALIQWWTQHPILCFFYHLPRF
jgi:hypothetical protein